MPTIYFTGTEAPLAELPHQRGEPNVVDTRLADLFARNGVTDDYAFDSAAVHRARHETLPIQGEIAGVCQPVTVLPRGRR